MAKGSPTGFGKPVTPRALLRAARTVQGRDTAAARAENVANVVVGCADDVIDVGLVLAQHGAAIVVGVGIVRGRAGSAAAQIIGGVGYEIVVGDNVHVDGHDPVRKRR